MRAQDSKCKTNTKIFETKATIIIGLWFGLCFVEDEASKNAPANGVVGNHGDDVDAWLTAAFSCYPTTRASSPYSVHP